LPAMPASTGWTPVLSARYHTQAACFPWGFRLPVRKMTHRVLCALNALPMHGMRNDNRGLTFVELMVVTVMLAVIALGLFGMLSQGIKVWRAVTQKATEQDAALFFDRFTGDVRNSQRFFGLPMEGSSDRLELVTLVQGRTLGVRSVGKAVYAYDAASGTLGRTALDFSQASTRKEELPSPLLPGVSSFDFRYYFFDVGKSEYVWKEELPAGAIPLAVRLEAEFADGRKAVKSASILFTK